MLFSWKILETPFQNKSKSLSQWSHIYEWYSMNYSKFAKLGHLFEQSNPITGSELVHPWVDKTLAPKISIFVYTVIIVYFYWCKFYLCMKSTDDLRRRLLSLNHDIRFVLHVLLTIVVKTWTKERFQTGSNVHSTLPLTVPTRHQCHANWTVNTFCFPRTVSPHSNAVAFVREDCLSAFCFFVWPPS